jgi:predicted membrane protein
MGFELYLTFVLFPIHLLFNIAGQILEKKADFPAIFINLFLVGLFIFMDISSLNDCIIFNITFGILLLYYFFQIIRLFKINLKNKNRND